MSPRPSSGARRTRLIAAIALIAATLAVAPAATAGVVMCNGVPATIVGGPDDDVLPGTNGPDVIAGLGGNDTINALDGDDLLCGGPGHDTIDAGAGDDVVYAGSGSDTVWGDRGNDSLFGGRGRDFVDGGSGSDDVRGGGGDDEVRGGGLADCDFPHGCYLGHDTDVVVGGWGDDVIVAGAPGHPYNQDGGESIALFPKPVAHTVTSELQDLGEANPTRIQTATGEGTDTLIGPFSFTTGAGPDAISITDADWPTSVRSGAGNDTVLLTGHYGYSRGTVTPGPGDDIVTGGFVILPEPVAHVVDLAGGFATGEGNDTLIDVCGARTGPGDDVIMGTNASDVIIGGDGDDQLHGLGGRDWLIGGYGSDLIDGGGNEGPIRTCSGLPGGDFDERPHLESGPGDVAIFPEPVDHVVDLAAGTSTGAGYDVLVGIENVAGGPANDVLLGDSGDNILTGGLGDDELRGRGGDDWIEGDPTPGTVESCDPVVDPIPGNDVIHGGPGNDILIGAPGDDLLFGGPGDDYLAGENGECPGLSDYLPSENVLRGGPGDDFLDGWGGTDVIYGGFDHDRCRVEDRRGRVDVYWSCEEFVGF